MQIQVNKNTYLLWLGLTLSAALMLSACHKKPASDTQGASPASSQGAQAEPKPIPTPVEPPPVEAMPFVGEYHGKLPCADCDYMALDIEVKADGLLVFNRDYVGKADAGLNTTVPWYFDKAHQRIHFKVLSQTYFMDKPSAQHLRLLDLQGQPIKHATAKQYLLHQQATQPTLPTQATQAPQKT